MTARDTLDTLGAVGIALAIGVAASVLLVLASPAMLLMWILGRGDDGNGS